MREFPERFSWAQGQGDGVDTPSGLHGESHIFMTDKGDYYEISDGLPKYERSSPGVMVAGD